MESRTGNDRERETEPAQGPEVPEEPPSAYDPVDEVIAESFPASDPPQWWAGRSD